MKIGALSLFSKTNERGRISLAYWHSAHSLTWRWVLSATFVRPWPIKPLFVWRSPRKHHGHGGGSFGVSPLLMVAPHRHNGGWQLLATIFCLRLDFSQQQSMFYRDMYRRERDRELEADFASQRPAPMPVIEHRTLQ